MKGTCVCQAQPPVTMNDLIYLGITAAFFIGSALYVRFCANL